MGLLLICPYCQAKSLALPDLPGLPGDLRDLAPAERRYFIGRPGAPEATPPLPEIVSHPVPEADELELGELTRNHDGCNRPTGEQRCVAV